MNSFFSTIITNLNILEYPVLDPIYNDINDPVLKSILKYKDHPSIKAIEKIAKLNSLFRFSNVVKREILNESVNLAAPKSCQDTDVPTKLLKRIPKFLQTLLTRQLLRSIKISFHLF